MRVRVCARVRTQGEKESLGFRVAHRERKGEEGREEGRERERERERGGREKEKKRERK